MKKLTPTMLKALKRICESPGPSWSFELKTGEALRARGLVNRYTTYSIKAEYATPTEITLQFKVPVKKAHAYHEWDATKAGYQANRELNAPVGRVKDL